LIALDVRIPMLLVGAILLLAALLSGRFFGNAVRTAVGKFSRAAIAVVGAVPIVWVLGSYLGSHTRSATEPLAHAHPRSQHRRLIFWEPRAVRCRPVPSRLRPRCRTAPRPPRSRWQRPAAHFRHMTPPPIHMPSALIQRSLALPRSLQVLLRDRISNHSTPSASELTIPR
jgi:hypothetical protein